MTLRRIISMSVILLLLLFFFTLGILIIIVGCTMSDALVISSSLFGCFVSSCAAMFCTTVIGNTFASRRATNRKIFENHHLTRSVIVNDLADTTAFRLRICRIMTIVLVSISFIVSLAFILLESSCICIIPFALLVLSYYIFTRIYKKRLDSYINSLSIYCDFVRSVIVVDTESPPTYGWDLAHERWIFDENILITNRDITPYVFEHEPVYIVKDGKGIIRRIISKNEFTADDDLCGIAYQTALPAKDDGIH